MEGIKLQNQEDEEKEFNARMAEVVRIELRSFKNVLEQIRDEGKDAAKRRDIRRTLESLKDYKQYRSISIERRVKIFERDDLFFIEQVYYIMDIFPQNIVGKFDKYLEIDYGEDKDQYEKRFEEVRKLVNDSLPHIDGALKTVPAKTYAEVTEPISKAEVTAIGSPLKL